MAAQKELNPSRYYVTEIVLRKNISLFEGMKNGDFPEGSHVYVQN
jgi:hypothetical protein